MLAGTYYVVLHHDIFLSALFPYLSSFWETADLWGPDNWCSTVVLLVSDMMVPFEICCIIVFLVLKLSFVLISSLKLKVHGFVCIPMVIKIIHI